MLKFSQMTQQQAIDHWLSGASDALDTAEKLMELKKYHHSLFFAHLYLEKTIKAYYIYKLDTSPLFTHDLVLLLTKTNFKLSQTQLKELKEITGFNMEARYEQDKLQLYKKATPKYSQLWFKKIKEYGQWIENLINKS